MGKARARTDEELAATFEKKNDAGTFLPEVDFHIVEKAASLKTLVIAAAGLEA